MWEQFGFTQNPYDHFPVSADDAGERLLVGRSKELEALMLRIKGRNAIPILEGDIGIGKTSIIAVSSFKLEREFLINGGQCYLTLNKPFQIEPSQAINQFSENVYREILIKIHEMRNELIDRSVDVGDTKKLYDWLSSEQYLNISGSVGGFGGGFSNSPNMTEGFSSLGFQNNVNQLLKKMFPHKKKGGIICVIDNLELLEKSSKARATLEAMRDKVLTAHGLIWIVCGARGIVRGVASSPRLQGYLSNPIDIKPIPLDRIQDLIQRRVSEYKDENQKTNCPVEQEGFNHIFKICNENLRISFKFCCDFAEWLIDNPQEKLDSSEKLELLKVWLAGEADEFLRDAKLTPKPWEIFDRIIENGGSIAPSDHPDFGYETPMAMRPHIKALEDAGLVESTIDETDQRRRTIAVTPKGWLISYSRRGYPE
ncbi:MAG: hypothetical protein AAGE18_04425 [Pseudomonadota bacterium]